MSAASVHKTFEKVIKELDKELDDPDLHPVLRANYLAVRKDCNALVDAVMAIAVEEVASATEVVNEKIERRFRDPADTVDPYEPHVFPEEAPAEVAEEASEEVTEEDGS